MRPNRRNLEQSNFPGLIITLPSEVVIKEIPSVKIKTSTIEVSSIKEIQNERKIVAIIKNIGDVTLWESDSYDRIGQWTDDDVQTRLIEIFLK